MPGIQGSIPGPQGAEDLPASGDLAPRQFIASKCVLLERCLIGEVRRPLGGDRTGSRTESYSLGSDESGNFGIAIVVRHDCPLIAGHSEDGALLVLCLGKLNWIWHSRSNLRVNLHSLLSG